MWKISHFLVGSCYFPIYIQINAKIPAIISINGSQELHYKNFTYKILFSNREFNIAIKYIAHSKWLDTFKSLSCLSEYSILVNITAEELQAKGNTLIPRFRNDTDKSGNDWRVEKVLHMPFAITISFKNLKAKDEKILNGSIMSIQILQLIL